MRKMLLVFLTFGLALGAPAGWVSFADKTGKCVFKTPADWEKGMGSFVYSSDKSGTAHAQVKEGDLASIKQAVSGFKPTILKENANQLFYRVVVAGTTEFYMALVKGPELCIVRANSKKPALEATLKEIAASAAWK